MKTVKKVFFENIELVGLDFDGVFTDNSVYIDSSGYESVKCSRLDGIGLERLKEANIHAVIISSEKNNLVQHRAKKLNIECYNGIEDKGHFISQFCKKHNYHLKNCIFLGNDINDLPILKIVSYPILVNDFHNSLKDYDFYLLDSLGGNGAVRELCEKVISDLNS